MRMHLGFHAPVPMITEYQAKFLSPCCYTTVISTSRITDPYHPLKGSKDSISTFKLTYVAHKHPPKALHSSMLHDPQCSASNHGATRVDDNTSVHKNNLQVRRANIRHSYQPADSLKANQGLPSTSNSKEVRSQESYVAAKAVPPVQEKQPFSCITTYSSDYVTHPVQPRTRREKPVYAAKALPLQPTVILESKLAWDINQGHCDKDSELIQEFKTWSLESKSHGQGKAKETRPRSHHNDFLSTIHAEHKAHKPYLPHVETTENTKQPFTTTTTMMDDYKASPPSVHKSWTGPNPPESFSPDPKLNEKSVIPAAMQPGNL